MESCDNCRFWENSSPNVAHLDVIQLGLCKRRAPHVEPNDKLSIPQWPSTRHCDWCGDYDSSIEDEEFDINW
jgi:hypothetical protein